MSSLVEVLSEAVSGAFATAGYDSKFGAVTASDRPDLCQFQCNGALQAAKPHGEKPRDVALKVVDALRAGHGEIFAKIDVAGPGFINLDLTDEHLAAQIARQADDVRLGVDAVPAPKKVFIDYGGANIAKPMHVGHLRSSIIGDSLKRIARFLEHEVVGDIHLGDWGLQMGMLIAELARRQPELPYFDDGSSSGFPAESPVSIEDLQRLYPEASARAKADPQAMEAARLATVELQAGRPGYRALWQHFVDVSVAELRADFAALGVEFDLWLGESDVADQIPDLIEQIKSQGAARIDQGALIVDVAEPGDKRELPPLLLTKSDGAALYATTDLATIEQRVAAGAELVLYVVDNRQADHFVQVFRAARKTGLVPPGVELEHIGFGTMNGKDGKPFKTREGGVMRLKDLMSSVTAKARERMTEAKVAADYSQDEKESIATDVGLAALKYADLVNHRAKDYVFDLDRFSSFEGKTGPYMLYAVVRVKSILDNAAARGLLPGGSAASAPAAAGVAALVPPSSDAERRLLLTLAAFPDVVKLAFDVRAPSQLAEYAHTLATTFNKFYSEHHILSESDAARQASWLTLVSYTARVLEKALDMLGIRVPRRM